ncbi:solute carrier family 23 member 2-like isoform X2 [Limulus polyphemus]|uniref:Solute carrier family 23 member 2-like isoform X2 n=1 Tax=Limulus polyphemus TaxID=6850 RepID=A0ABM1S2Q1_LIMPO|nr:solute carrier family 23 member 2-like isoform X2 [Limulus polyphemus]
MVQDNPDYELKIERDVVENEIQDEVDEPKVSIVDIKDEGRVKGDILYKVDETPRWYLCVLLGIQQYLTMFGSTVAYPYMITPKLCIQESDPARGYITSTIFFVSGLGTLIQSTFGTRLPIIQGPSFTFLASIFAILNLPQWKCSSEEEMLSATEEELQEIWQLRMREIQGAIIVASIIETVIGLTGVIGIILQWLTPLVIVPTIALIGLSLFEEAASEASKNWGIAILTIFLLVLFSKYLESINISCCSYSKERGWKIKQLPFFKLFPVLLTIVTAWVICFILTASGALGPTNAARTDLRVQTIHSSPWFRFPYPGQWGLPTVSIGAVLGMFAGILASILESIGDYYACARLACVPRPPPSAINRGIFAEGISCIISGIWGSGSGMTSYSQNIGAIEITKVASRRVIQYGAVTMIMFAVLGKLGAFLNTIPEPIIGGIFCVMFAIITGVGLSNAQFIDLHSSRNIIILGLSLFMGITIPKWFKGHPGTIDVGNDAANQLITVLLNTGVFVGGLIAFVLDNSIPGTDEERGLIKWREQGLEHNISEGDESTPLTYDLPFGMNVIKRYKIFKYIPISPTYDQNIFLGKVRALFNRCKPQKYNNHNIDSQN